MTVLRRCAIVGGGGAVGGLFAEHLLRSGADVSVVDIRAPGSKRLRFVPGDITDPAPDVRAELAAADLVMLAVSEPVALAALDGTARLMRPGGLLVDTLSVKGRIVTRTADLSRSVEVLSLNPMFAPALGFRGRPVATVVVRDGGLGRELLRLISSWGGQVITVSGQQHDRIAGACQALTHCAVLAFGAALDELGAEIAELRPIAPPPHQTLLALLARIASGEPEVYWDVQAANPAASDARRALATAARRIAELVESGDDAAFREFLARSRQFFGSELGHYRDTCARAFEATLDTER